MSKSLFAPCHCAHGVVVADNPDTIRRAVPRVDEGDKVRKGLCWISVCFMHELQCVLLCPSRFTEYHVLQLFATGLLST
jgi:hypothetical protein